MYRDSAKPTLQLSIAVSTFVFLKHVCVARIGEWLRRVWLFPMSVNVIFCSKIQSL